MISRTVDCVAVRDSRASEASRCAPEETPVALVYDGTTHAVLMATPADLEDLGRGFSLTEGMIDSIADIADIEVAEQPDGIEVRMWLRRDASRALVERRRAIVGPTGCGLCGVESLAAAVPVIVPVTGELRLRSEDVIAAAGSLRAAQPLGDATRAVHAAGWWSPAEGLVAAREDVGRHNALDKLAGALALTPAARDGVVVLTSRVSVEMVQKAARIGAGAIVAISAPTALAIRVADAANITLAAVVRDDGFEVFTHSRRIDLLAEPKP